VADLLIFDTGRADNEDLFFRWVNQQILEIYNSVGWIMRVFSLHRPPSHSCTPHSSTTPTSSRGGQSRSMG
jgi:hypothetical protein